MERFGTLEGGSADQKILQLAEIFAIQFVHHLADVSQTSAAFGIFVGAVTATCLLLRCDFFNDQRSPVFDEILFDIICRISKTMAYQVI
jgi:hypothetical protein